MTALTESNSLVLQQITVMASNDFDITDADGVVVGKVKTTGSSLGRLAFGARNLEICGPGGELLVRVVDDPNVLLDTYQLFDAQDANIASLTVTLNFIGTRVRINAYGQALRLDGKINGLDFEILRDEDGQSLAQVQRQWAGLSCAMRGRSRYTLDFTPDASPEMRAVILGSAVALDLLRAKKRRS